MNYKFNAESSKNGIHDNKKIDNQESSNEKEPVDSEFLQNLIEKFSS